MELNLQTTLDFAIKLLPLIVKLGGASEAKQLAEIIAKADAEWDKIAERAKDPGY